MLGLRVCCRLLTPLVVQGKTHLITPETWTVRVGSTVLASRTQVNDKRCRVQPR